MSNSQPLPPANLAALRGILGKSKALMEHVESDNYEKGNLDPTAMVTSDQLVENAPAGMAQAPQMRQPVAQLQYQQPVPQPQYQQPPAASMNANRGYNDQMVDNSRLPANIKEAMKQHPIPALDPTAAMQSFSLEDMGDLVETPAPAPQRQQVNEQQYYQQQPVQNNVNEQMIRQIVKEELMNILGGQFTKKIREDAIKSTIKTLIKEGKITPRKKQVARKRAQ